MVLKDILKILHMEPTVDGKGLFALCYLAIFDIHICAASYIQFVLPYPILSQNVQKSLDGYYQESGRAGRDGQDADCVLYYRPQDATRQSSITCTDKESQAKHMQECRKILFAKYFSASSDLCMLAWTTEESHATERCGHCDNCLRQPGTFVHQDVTLAAWQILKILETVHTQGGRQTIAGLGDLTRGLGGGTYDTSGKRRNTKTKEQLDYGSIAGGKVELSKDDVETLIVHLLVSNYVGEAFSSTAYAINVYVIPGNLAIRLTRFTRAEIVNGLGPRIHCSFRRIPRKGKGKATASTHTKVTTTPGDLDLDDSNEETVVGPSNSGRLLTRFWGKNKRPHEEAVEELAEVESGEDFTEKIRMIDDSSDADDDIADDLDWEYSMRPMRQLKKRRMMNGKSKEASVEVISLSSD
ncbi:hypothetical protein ID866_6039 [Astraeus odoratus]|nr:hypothetical protein ID866_6039 [Astraeus odoratus]